ncbi:uncharacterized protein LOC104676270 isoform X1 [Rhinopithecus roxellana]|uniref:uncharacterized protein LOC104676270 isoform X1 n=1 Tax=Rhinopithecus roxellana TaxID=61622 RepID=UPI001237868F|nr:uncharacterized protein LOC104676270 isoform X1 [Rhinopithecus roxellana]XP_030785342.1 uncharacterized protein LOC104676270 isoform X1 [Rhinopithecus roxellana]XP_030785343.1 uncharacterized protein LOC104676270 isoform X1 [Rhinopithecus roxellana]XP_030785344.1 uncharacterized protein LOC104676270 isoform X1 [Rhinopithecus roxellana]
MSWQSATNGEKSLPFDMMNMTWTVINHEASKIKETWKKDRGLEKYFRKLSVGDCDHWLREFLGHWEAMPEPTGGKKLPAQAHSYGHGPGAQPPPAQSAAGHPGASGISAAPACLHHGQSQGTAAFLEAVHLHGLPATASDLALLLPHAVQPLLLRLAVLVGTMDFRGDPHALPLFIIVLVSFTYLSFSALAHLLQAKFEFFKKIHRADYLRFLHYL